MKRAVFWDRDGTLIEDCGFIGDPAQMILFPATVDALRRLREQFVFFIVTNQAGVAKGAITSAGVERVNEALVSALGAEGIRFQAIYICPHGREDGCACRKPSPYFLAQAAHEHGIDLSASFVVGDHPSDMELARQAGAKGIYVRTGHGQKHLDELPPGEIVVADIGAAADWILRQAAVD